MQFLWEYLKTASKPIVLYGMGNGADKIIKILEDKNIPFEGVFASDGFVRNKSFHGFKISSLAELEAKFGDLIILLCFGSERPEVLEMIKGISARHELYAPDVPVIGDGLFDRSFVTLNAQRFRRIYSLLADDISRKTFENVVQFKLSGDINLLFGCAVDRNEPQRSFLNLTENECFFDLGAYNGDTALEFASLVKKHKNITAVEPDKKSFEKLVRNTADLSDIRLVNAAVSDRVGTGLFDMKKGRNSSLGKSGVPTELITVDKLSEAIVPTLIKMDLEGGEKKAIVGAESTIKAHRPKLRIAAYHRNEDLISIPEQILNIRCDYKIYIRHFPALPAWDIDYFFV